jgi:hypothetical protein
MTTAHFTKEEATLCKCKKNDEMQVAFPRNSFFSIRIRVLSESKSADTHPFSRQP